ncbi:hypothetical protein PHMEG_00032417 [Phytophthora megakarya]|uniref:Chromo domain-containing protein n=1 Tax=Phytophthora megakarya TaxID=4795 RepID=A0A225UW06_9STRA|nr:hypothetical protein PHMEG_00032417 [Phytophthora megakarya]
MAYIAAESLSLWCARYGTPKMLRSDQGSHFKNEVVKDLASRLKVELDFTPVYSPWLNGTVERLNKDVLQVTRALLLDQFEPYPGSFPCRLAGHAPIEVLTALPAMSPSDTIIVPANTDRNEQRLLDMASHKGSLANFDVGDFVLWSRIDQRLPNNKLLGHWIGPFRITAACPHSFKIEHLITGRKYEVHASSLKFYADSELDVTEEFLELVGNQGMLIGVEEFVDHRFNKTAQRWELFVSWLGLQAIENSWEPLTTLLQDVPEKVCDYVLASGDDERIDQVD